MRLLLRCVRHLWMAWLALHSGLLVAKSISTQMAVANAVEFRAQMVII